MALWAASEAFFAKHLGGRFQQAMTPEVATRLKEITVDPKTVVLAKKVEVAAAAPKPAAELRPGTTRQQVKIEAGGQTMLMSVTRTIEEKDGAWLVTETAKTSMGDVVDSTVLDKATLVVRKRSIRQGPMAIDLAFEGGKATGTMAMGAAPKAVSVDLGGDLFADGAGEHEAIATLPLAEGYATSFRNFDVPKQKVALKQLKVLGRESVTVAAGTFDTWKVEITSAEGEPGQTTVWVASDSRQVVKVAASLPQMGGALMTTELQP